MQKTAIESISNAKATNRHAHWLPSQRLKIMRLLTVFLLGYSLAYSATPAAQTVSLSGKKLTMKQVFLAIEKQTGYVILGNEEVFTSKKILSLAVRDAPLQEFLHQVLSNQAFEYDIQGKTIFIARKFPTLNSRLPDIHFYGLFSLQSVSGRVTDSLGNPIADASVKLTPGNKGTSTNKDGAFNIANVGPGSYTLEISIVGYKVVTRNIVVSENEPLRLGGITLRVAPEALEDFVVNTGYQRISKERATGSYATLNKDILDNRLQPNLATMLEGQLAGLTVDQNNQIVIRGISTLNASRKPLIVIDGYPVEPSITDNFYRYDDGLFKDINAANIESVTVLKDAVAASIYGTRAANGVVVIVTKRGREGDARFSYRGVTGFAPRPNLSNLNKASTNDYIDAEIDLFNLNPAAYNINTGTAVVSRVSYLLRQVYQGDITKAAADEEINQLRNNDYLADVQKYLYRPGFSQQHNLSVSGGTQKHTYNLALNYMNVRQNFKDANSDRFTVDLKEDWKFSKIISAGAAANISYSNFKTPTINPDRSLTLGDGVGNQTLFNFHTGSYFTPYTSLFDEAGNVANLWGQSVRKQLTYGDYKGMKNVGYDFVNDVSRSMASTKNFQARLTGFVRANIIQGLSAEIGGNWQRGSYKYQRVRDRNEFAVREAFNDSKSLSNPANHYLPDGAIVDENRNNNENWTVRAQLNFSRSLGGSRHLITAIAGAEIRKMTIDKVTLATRVGYNEQAGAFTPVNALDYNSTVYGNDMLFGRRIVLNTGSYDLNDNRFTSWYGNGSYEYDNRFIVSGSIRLDQTNFFGTDPKYRYRPLWSVGGTWKLSNEKFFNGGFVNKLYVRGSYGINGNISLNHGPYLILANATFNTTAQSMGSSIASPPNDQLRWEKTKTADIGLDMSIFNNWVDLTVDWYTKRSSDVLASAAVDQTVGYTSVMQNVGKINNSGIEVSVSSKIINNKDFRWSITSNFAYNSNMVKEYNVTMAVVGNYMASTGVNVKGYPVNGLWGLRFAPLNSVGAAMITSAKGTPVLSSQALAEDAYYIGPTIPVYDLSFTNRLAYKSLDLSFMIITKLGHYYQKDAFHSRNIQNKHVGERWRKPGDEAWAKVPALTTTNSDWWYASNIDINMNRADFARLRDITLSYDFNRNHVQKIGLASAKVYIQGRNLLTVRAKGMDIDPETMVPYAGGTNGNVDYSFSSLPLAREVYVGLQITF